jgi:tetratricopeptide (TPR) repeat protein
LYQTERHDGAAQAYKGLLRIQNPDGTGPSMLSKNELICNIGEIYYNTGDLQKAEKYFECIESVDSGDDLTRVMQRKISWKRSGYN